jgi:hypothetical protein
MWANGLSSSGSLAGRTTPGSPVGNEFDKTSIREEIS